MIHKVNNYLAKFLFSCLATFVLKFFFCFILGRIQKQLIDRRCNQEVAGMRLVFFNIS